ncbi:MAG: metallophosphoesterase family protein [Bdellovibrionales bacterium]|jgi:serine/threonine protein phosphatase 1|nr:metallophosphoesterase family protein [Bdellovibrionales bacterium]
MFKRFLSGNGSSSAKTKNRRIYAIGDVHGCALELEKLISMLEIDRDTLVVFLGDYVDRGTESRRVIDLVLELRGRCEVVALMGNHEAMFLDFLERPESIGSGLFVLNGGGTTLANYAGPKGSFEIPKAHVDFLKGLKLFHETEHHFFVHAGVPLRKRLADLHLEEDRETFLWTRGPFLTTEERWEKIIVHGHTPNADPERRANRINVDTGCVFGGALTAYDVNRDQFISVERIEPHLRAVPQLIDEGPLRVAVRFNGRMPVSVGKPGQKRFGFVTLNYNQFGLLLQALPAGEADSSSSEEPYFTTGDVVEGTIGDDHRTAVEFEGQIVRAEHRQELALYGVKLDRVSADHGSSGDESEGWLVRPG